MRNGQRRGLSFGFMANVRISPTSLSSHTLIAVLAHDYTAGSGKSILWYVILEWFVQLIQIIDQL